MNKNKILLTILILTIPYLILIGNFYFYLYNEDFYYKQFKENNVNVEDKELILKNLLNFFKDIENQKFLGSLRNSKEFQRDKDKLNYFNENERAHLIDVKNLINKFISLFYIFIILDILLLIILFIKLKKNNKNIKNYIKKILLYSGLFTIFIIFILFILSLNFDFLFENFHRLFFTGNWIFPKESLLIQLFPFIFFQNFFVKILIDSFIISSIFVLISFLINIKYLK